MKKMIKCMDDPETGKVVEKQDTMIQGVLNKDRFDEVVGE